MREERGRWLAVVLYAIGMAWVESAAVYYLRAMVDRIEPYQVNPLPIHGVLGPVELTREAATLLMLATVGYLGARTWEKRLGYAALAFGVWDIFYYVFLRIICGWPTSLFDWDILFLLPLPWWGPVIAPVSIAVLMIVWGTLVTQWRDEAPRVPAFRWTRWATPALTGLGMAMALYVFMADALRAAQQGLDVRLTLPTSFLWPVFVVALALMAAPIAHIGWRITTRTR